MGSTPIKNISYQDLDQVATQTAPATGKTRLYSKTDGALYVVPAAGSETAVSSSIPANLIAYTTDTTAPSGWAEFTAGRGRVIVATPASGTNAGTVGTALTNLQDPTHTHTGPSHTHVLGDAGASFLENYVYPYVLHYGGALKTLGGYYGAQSQIATDSVAASGTGATSATSATTPYIQQLGIKKS